MAADPRRTEPSEPSEPARRAAGAGAPPTVMLVGEALIDGFADAEVPGGAPLNAACALQALGLPAHLLSRLGLSAGRPDRAAELLLQTMRRFGLSEAGLQFDAAHATGQVRIDEAQGGHRFEILADVAWDHLEPGPCLRELERQRPAVLYFGTLAQRAPASAAAIEALLHRAGELGLLRYLDLNLRPGASDAGLAERSLALADWLKVNDEELAQLLQWFGAAAAADGVAALMRRFGLRRLLLTRGAQGYACYGPAGELLAQGEGVRVSRWVDSVGAGDAFSAMLLAASLRGLELRGALALANRFAAALCEQRGPVASSPDFYAAWRVQLDQALRSGAGRR